MLFHLILVAFLIVTPTTSKPYAAASQNRFDIQLNPRKSMPTVGEVIERFIKAVGGKAAWLKVKSQYAAGTIEVPALGNKGTYEAHTKAPDKSLVVMKLISGELRTGFDGQRGWSQTWNNEIQYDPAPKTAARKRDADFYKYLHFKQHFPVAKLIGIEVVEGKKTYLIEATSAGEKIPESLFFDIDTGFLIRRDTKVEDEKGGYRVESQFYDDYREVGGIKVSFGQRIVQDTIVIIRKHTEVKNNLAMDDAIFSPPSKVQTN